MLVTVCPRRARVSSGSRNCAVQHSKIQWSGSGSGQKHRIFNVRGWSGYPPKLSVKADIPDGQIMLHFNQGCCRWATNPDKCGLYQHGICWIPCSGRVCRPKNKLKVRAGRAGGSHHKARHCWCDDPRSRLRGGRRRCVGRRHLPHRSFVSERSFQPQGVHWALGFYYHKL
jgi:hypothetical protein